MTNLTLNCIYFSATGTTDKCVEAVAAGMNIPVMRKVNLADGTETELKFGNDDVVIVALPVYGGRIPALTAETIGNMTGGGARAVALVVYGNRDYDDALLELTELLRDADFRIVGAGAAVAQHSIFPTVGKSRPDAEDLRSLADFGHACREVIEMETYGHLNVKGLVDDKN